jgi:hypothetical protein
VRGSSDRGPWRAAAARPAARGCPPGCYRSPHSAALRLPCAEGSQRCDRSPAHAYDQCVVDERHRSVGSADARSVTEALATVVVCALAVASCGSGDQITVSFVRLHQNPVVVQLGQHIGAETSIGACSSPTSSNTRVLRPDKPPPPAGTECSPHTVLFHASGPGGHCSLGSCPAAYRRASPLKARSPSSFGGIDPHQSRSSIFGD